MRPKIFYFHFAPHFLRLGQREQLHACGEAA